MKRKPLRKSFVSADERRQWRLRFAAEYIKRGVMRRLISLSEPSTLAPSSDTNVFRTRWSWVGLSALVGPQETLDSVENAVRGLVEEKILLSRIGRKGRRQVTLA